jgi:hypothetical protein
MKMQTGMRVEVEVWQAYRALCSREHLRPSMPIEDFLKLVLDKGSALTLLSLVRGAVKTQSEGVNAYARVLLNWYTHGKHFFHAMGQDEASVEGLLLESLKVITDLELCRQIEEALMRKP